MNYPEGIIFVNSNISSQVLETIQRQLFITETLDFNSFNEYINDGYSGIDGYNSGGRLLVLLNDFQITENRDKADVVLYVKLGLAYILKNNFGPTGLTVQVDRMYIHKLFLENGKLI